MKDMRELPRMGRAARACLASSTAGVPLRKVVRSMDRGRSASGWRRVFTLLDTDKPGHTGPGRSRFWEDLYLNHYS